MSWITFPPMVHDVTALDHDKAQAWGSWNVPTNITFFEDLVPALCHALDIEETPLHFLVGKKFHDDQDFTWATVAHWIECATISSDQLFYVMTTEGHMVDRLFIWLASIVKKTHLNFGHHSSIWTLRSSDSPNMLDVVVIFTDQGFLTAPLAHGEVTKVEQPDMFQDPLDTIDSYERKPIVLHSKVQNVWAHCMEIDVETCGGPCPLHHLLAELCSLNLNNYRIQLSSWVECHLLHLKCISTWCQVRGQSMDDFYDHLQRGGSADGLEILLVSLALDVQINVVLEDIIWTSSTASVDFGKPTILISIAGAYACLLHDSLDGQLADVDTTVTNDSVDPEEDVVPS